MMRVGVCVCFSSEKGAVAVQNCPHEGLVETGPFTLCTSWPCEVKPAGVYTFYRKTDNEQRRRTKEQTKELHRVDRSRARLHSL